MSSLHRYFLSHIFDTSNLRAPVSPAIPLDRICLMISHNPHLQSLVLYFQGMLPNVLRLASLVIQEVAEIRIGGLLFLSQQVDCLSAPKLSLLAIQGRVQRTSSKGLLTQSTTALSVLNPLPSQFKHLLLEVVGDMKFEELSLGYNIPPNPNLTYSFIRH